MQGFVRDRNRYWQTQKKQIYPPKEALQQYTMWVSQNGAALVGQKSFKSIYSEQEMTR